LIGSTLCREFHWTALEIAAGCWRRLSAGNRPEQRCFILTPSPPAVFTSLCTRSPLYGLDRTPPRLVRVSDATDVRGELHLVVNIVKGQLHPPCNVCLERKNERKGGPRKRTTSSHQRPTERVWATSPWASGTTTSPRPSSHREMGQRVCAQRRGARAGPPCTTDHGATRLFAVSSDGCGFEAVCKAERKAGGGLCRARAGA